MSISINGVPLENFGFGTQNMFKSEIFLLQNTDVDKHANENIKDVHLFSTFTLVLCRFL